MWSHGDFYMRVCRTLCVIFVVGVGPCSKVSDSPLTQVKSELPIELLVVMAIDL